MKIWLNRASVPVGLCVFVALLAQVPLLHNPTFYFTDDSAAQFLPMWHRLGEQLLAGNWPPLLDNDAWMGGNLAAEALFGVWNPVNLANYLLVAGLDDLALAATVVKTEFLMLLALGVYLLCREYGAARWASAALAVALPFGGFTLYFQASTWVAGLMAFAWVPYVWWSARRTARGQLYAVWPFVFGALCVTNGNPYGVLGVCAVLLGLLLEFWLRKDRRAVYRVLLVGGCVAAVVPLVFLPLLGASTVGLRTGKELFNLGQLVPAVTDLLNLSMPSHLPSIRTFNPNAFRMTVPATYFAWFVLPLLAWLDFGVLRRRWRELTAAFVVAGGYLLLSLGPSNLWMFRWPLRHVESLFLALAVLTAVLLSAGLRTDRLRLRILATGGILLLSGYLAFAAWPKISLRHLFSLALLGGLTALVVLAARRGGRWTGRLSAAVLCGGTAIVLLLQTTWQPYNADVAGYKFPRSTEALHEQFAKRYRGTTVQIADRGLPGPNGENRDLLFGNMYAAAGVPTLTAYTGMGFKPLHKALCLTFYGGTCRRAYPALFQPTESGRSLADLLRVETIVVQRSLFTTPEVKAPPIPGAKIEPDPLAGLPEPAYPPVVYPGWRVEESNDAVTVLRRVQPLEWSEGRLSQVGAGVRIEADKIAGQRTELVRFSRSGPLESKAELTFARLNWPGYSATVNDQPVAVRNGPAGTVVVELPAGVRSGELRLHWDPPGFKIGIGSALAGLLAALALCVVQFRSRRRTAGDGRFGGFR
ncbi:MULTISPECIES: hypothetical protein [unclassified Crossiella]|uniref:hypothetical protein n=1 Tax=unclassified Crossiella TaxID=2620835 RepID=UPI001FFEAEFF|nr:MULTISPECIES: hypothetical protein [unclassified Crossiella]MCK2237528.1 hypothetical protein [Crossiella sp. S99.2]MCK2254814.1 hypothetical protein [Crossiella sp. S99.1]